MAHTFKVTKTRKPSAQVKGGSRTQKSTTTGAQTGNTVKPSRRLVVSAVSKTPITVTPTPVAPKKEKKVVKASAQSGPQATAQVPRKRGRPSKAATPAPTVATSPTPKPAGRTHRIDNTRLLEAAGQVRSHRVPLAASRIVEQLESLLARSTIETFRGRKKIEQLTLSKLEEQALQEALSLFQMKVTLQRGGSLRRAHAS